MKAITLALPASLLFSACATLVAPTDLQRPEQLTCINLSTPLTSTNERGLLKIVWVTRLERGPYVSERVDMNGTYYRAPPGGVSIYRPDMLDEPVGPFSHMAYDGGIWIPKDASLPPRLYNYYSPNSAPVRVPAENADCNSVAYAVDPTSSGVNIIEFATVGATGGAAGGLVGRSVASDSKMSYGQAAGVGAVGGAIAGAIVAGFINMDVGKIVLGPPLANPAFVTSIRAAAENTIPIRKASDITSTSVGDSAPEQHP